MVCAFRWPAQRMSLVRPESEVVMGSAMHPDGGRPRDGDRDDIPVPVDPADDRAYDDSDAVVAYSEDHGYVDDIGGSGEAFFAGDPGAATRETVTAREEERFGGIKIGSAFFGLLTATGMAVLLAALVTAAGTAGLLSGTDLMAAAGQTSSPTVGMAGMIVLLVILFLSFFSGGYVAGRMARFNGVGQGLMVWLWAVIVAAVVALLGIFGGGRFNFLATLNGFLRIPVNEGQASSTSGIIAAIVVAAVALMGAVLGGTAGMRYHRKVDRVGFTPTEGYYQP